MQYTTSIVIVVRYFILQIKELNEDIHKIEKDDKINVNYIKSYILFFKSQTYIT